MLYFLKKVSLIFPEMELPYIFSKKVFLIFQEMELPSPQIKKILIFSIKKAFLIFWNIFFFELFKKFIMKMELSELKKLKKKYSEKISYISRNGT